MSVINLFTSIISSTLISILKFYKKAISPWLPIACRYKPTCSEYMIEAIQKHGAWHGVILGIKRISRCHPWGGSGFDPVPEKIKPSKNDTD